MTIFDESVSFKKVREIIQQRCPRYEMRLTVDAAEALREASECFLTSVNMLLFTIYITHFLLSYNHAQNDVLSDNQIISNITFLSLIKRQFSL